MRTAGRALLAYCHNDDRGSIARRSTSSPPTASIAWSWTATRKPPTASASFCRAARRSSSTTTTCRACRSIACLSRTGAASARGGRPSARHRPHPRRRPRRQHRNSAGRERLEATCRLCASADVEIVPEYIIDGNWTESSGYAGMLRLLSLEHPPTALFCCNYNMAVGALALLKEHGLKRSATISRLSASTTCRCSACTRPASPRSRSRSTRLRKPSRA